LTPLSADSIILPAIGPGFISLQARDLDASQAFYEQYLGLIRSQAGPPHAVVFETKPIAFALRDVVPGTDLASAAQPGIGAAIWLPPQTSRPFTFADPDGYQITLHDRA
jgi:catechol 2,3-dioxygenase-like lactoylglutathione lyase family enzyme